MSDYIELHCHSNFSLLEGASHLDELLARAHALGYAALALTDHDGLYGSMQFARLATQLGIQPITGAEITLEDGSHLVLLAETRNGYGRLSRLISRAHLESERLHPRLPWSALDPADRTWRLPSGRPAPLLDPKTPETTDFIRHQGVIVLAGRCSAIGRALDDGRFDDAAVIARRLVDWFGEGNVFLELQQNFVRGDTRRIRQLARLGAILGIPLVASNCVHYHERDRHRLQDVLVAIKHRSTLAGSHRERRANGEFYLKAPAVMRQLFADYPAAIANTVSITERCQFNLARDLDYEFPSAEAIAQGLSDDDALETLCRNVLAERYGKPETVHLRPKAEQRLEEELALIRKHRLSGFLLVYHRILQLGEAVACQLRGVDPASPLRPAPGRGRGSSVSSLVCYLIGLSHIDPIKNDLFVGRFLNEEMRAVPDIDLDFPRDIREQLILRIYETYGHDHTALVCTFPTYRVRSAIREIGKVLDLPPVELDRLAKLSEGGSARSLAEEIEANPILRHRRHARGWQLLVDLADQIAGFPRHVSQHVGGMVISSRPLVELVPLERAAMPGRYICQWDKDSVDDARFIKIDFLALGMLSLVDECLDMIAATHGEKPDLSRIDFDDPAVYQMICEADTTGLFQIESRAQMSSLPSTQPRSLEDLAVQVAIVRPGPIVGGAFKPYLAYRRQLFGLDPSPFLPELPRPGDGQKVLPSPRLRRAGPLPGVQLGDRVDTMDGEHGALPGEPSPDWTTITEATPINPDFSWHAWRNQSRAASPDRTRPQPDYLHPLLEPVLKRTAGVILFQEQILQIAMVAANFSAGEAELLRRSLGRKNARDEIARMRQKFEEGARANGLSDEVIERVFAMFMGFAQFGFPESHAHAFGLLAYQSAWLRYYYPEEFFAALLNNQPMGFYPPHVLVNYARRAGMRFRRPSLNQGRARCSIEVDSVPEPPARSDRPPAVLRPLRKVIRLGFGYVRSIDAARATAIQAERDSGGPFRNLDDLLRRTLLPREAIENLIAAGALDDLAPAGTPREHARRELIWELGELARPVARQLTLPHLFAGLDRPQLPAVTPWEQLTADYQVLSLSPEHHPLAFLRDRLPPGTATSEMLRQAPDGTGLTIAGLVTTRQRPGSARGVVFMTIEDEFGKMDLIVHPRVYERYRPLVRGEPFLIVQGTVQRRDQITVHLVVHHLERLAVTNLAPTAHDMLPPPAHHFAHGYAR